jgi:ferredoxin-NADP reductase
MVPGLREHDIYVCGPPGMTERARAAIRHAKVPRRQIHHESFTF